jgi:hexosaminidase
MAMHKLNVLHLHLTDDQGWRIEINQYPRLTEVGAWRDETMIGNPLRPHSTHDAHPHGGYYTQDDLRELVAYAADRFITVIPEIDIPGHSQAAIAAYPHLGVSGGPLPVQTTWGVCENILNAEESTVEFYKNVLDEVLELFPSPYICVGGDECRKSQWRDDPRTQHLIRERGLKDEDELQSWFIRRFDEYLSEHGRRLFGWEEILEGGLARGATVASWSAMDAAVIAAERGHDVVTCPMAQTYLDFPESDSPEEPSAIGVPLPLENVYAFEPIPPGLTDQQATHILGAQACLWTEHIDNVRNLDYQAFPRLSAFSETVWSTPERDFADFAARLGGHLPRLEAVGVEYRRADGPRPWQTRPDRHGAAASA